MSISDLQTVWPEWSDADVNAEKWGASRGGGGKEKASKEDKSGKESARSGTTSGKTTLNLEPFDDPYPVPLPWSLKETDSWVRPDILYPDLKQVIFSTTSEAIPDLISLNQKLLYSSFIRSVIAAVSNLCYLGIVKPFVIEWQTSQYTANTQGSPWKPWHHIYSICKAGKGHSHLPLPNMTGRYVVRLYWMGCWRKIVVDDKYLVDSAGNILLPLSNIPNQNELELWPALLTKALMKIASLTWTDKKDIVDFDIVSCLTGWTVQKISTKGLDQQDIWDMLCGYSNHYTWDNRLILNVGKDEPEKSKITLENYSKKTEGSKKGASTGKSTGKSKKGKNVVPDVNTFYLTFSCTNLSTLNENEIYDMSPCFDHDILLEKTRSIPLITKIPDYDRNIPPWKEFRWVDWAVSKGLWHRVEEWEIFQCIKMVSNLRKADQYLLYSKETTLQEKFIKHSATIIDEFVALKERQKAKAARKGKKGSAREKRSPKGSKKPKIFTDPSIWCKFTELAPYINGISIYLKPSSFKVNYLISDISFNEDGESKAKKATKKEEEQLQYIHWQNVLSKSRNEPIYLFTDSVDSKLTIFTLTHLGNYLPKTIDPTTDAQKKLKKICRKLVCKLDKCKKDCICQKVSAENIVHRRFKDTRMYGNLIVEQYDWKSLSNGDSTIFLNTCGCSSVLMNFGKGRHVKRIWLNCNSPYVLLIFCDTEMKVGRLDEILQCMAEESALLTESWHNICESMALLIRYFGYPEYILALKNFYKSYMPSVNLSKAQKELIHETFLYEFMINLSDSYPSDSYYEVSRAIKIMLLNPYFRIPYTVHYKPYLAKDSDDDICSCKDLDGMLLKERSAIKIQAFFKMVYVKKLLGAHNFSDRKFQATVDLLKSIYTNLFSSKVRLTNSLVRKLIHNTNLLNLAHYFSYYKDLNSVIFLKSCFEDGYNVPANSWIPLVRRKMFCVSTTAVHVRAFIFSNLPNYVLRIFNNDNGQEVKKHINNAIIQLYEKNIKGYTVLAYGWTDDQEIKDLQWKLCIAIEKVLNICEIEIDNAKNFLTKIRGNYIPNIDNQISKFTVHIQDVCVGTFHFEASYPQAQIKIRCSDSCGTLLYEATGTSTVLIPVISLNKMELESSEKISLDSNIEEHKSVSGVKIKKSKPGLRKTSTKSWDKRSSLSGSGSKKGIRVSIPEADQVYTKYIIEAFVVENTWPLTVKEWAVVEKLRKRTSIEKELNLNGNSLFETSSGKILNEDRISINNSIVTGSAVSVTSISKKKSTPRKSFPKRQRLSSFCKEFLNESPYWTLTTINDTDTFMQTEADYSRIEVIKDIKRTLFENNVPRYLKGTDIRNDFLESHYIKWTPEQSEVNLRLKDFSSNVLSEDFNQIYNTAPLPSIKSLQPTQDEGSDVKFLCPECNKPTPPEEIVYLAPPESTHKMLVPFDLNRHDEADSKLRKFVTPEEEEKIFDKISTDINTFEKEYKENVETISKQKEEQVNKHHFWWKWYESIRDDSHEMIRDGEIKKEFLLRLIKERNEEESNIKGKGKEKKKKK